MRITPFIAIPFAAFMAAASAGAQEASPQPAAAAKKASEIVAQIEQRPDFQRLESVEWSDDGYYEITYHTADKAKVEIKIDSRTGQSRE